MFLLYWNRHILWSVVPFSTFLVTRTQGFSTRGPSTRTLLDVVESVGSQGNVKQGILKCSRHCGCIITPHSGLLNRFSTRLEYIISDYIMYSIVYYIVYMVFIE